MVELQFRFDETASIESDLFLKTIDDFILWLDQQEDEALPFSKDMGIMVRSRCSPDGQLHREIEFQSRSGAAVFLKLWRRAQQNNLEPKQGVFNSNQIGLVR